MLDIEYKVIDKTQLLQQRGTIKGKSETPQGDFISYLRPITLNTKSKKVKSQCHFFKDRSIDRSIDYELFRILGLKYDMKSPYSF